MLKAYAEAALKMADRDATSCFREHPRLNAREVAKAIGLERTPPLGLKLILYEEAAKTHCFRHTAIDMLFREIICEFPDGWTNQGIHPHIRLSSWDFPFKFIGVEKAMQRAMAVLRELTMTNPPAEGWLPQEANDPLIRRAFDLHWPDDEGEQSATATG